MDCFVASAPRNDEEFVGLRTVARYRPLIFSLHENLGLAPRFHLQPVDVMPTCISGGESRVGAISCRAGPMIAASDIGSA
jgi:hypothetical protein